MLQGKPHVQRPLLVPGRTKDRARGRLNTGGLGSKHCQRGGTGTSLLLAAMRVSERETEAECVTVSTGQIPTPLCLAWLLRGRLGNSALPLHLSQAHPKPASSRSPYDGSELPPCCLQPALVIHQAPVLGYFAILCNEHCETVLLSPRHRAGVQMKVNKG